MTEPPQWHEDAACRGTAPDIFFPIREEDAERARAVCFSCEVRLPCLAFALSTGQRYGVWGGLSEQERIEMSRSRSLLTVGREAAKAELIASKRWR